MALHWYIARRLLTVIPQVLGICTVTFILIHLLPGNPAYVMAGPLAGKDTIAAITHSMSLDKPIFIQYVLYLRGLMHGDLGRSWYTGQPVATDIGTRFPATFELISAALLVIFLASMFIGLVTARRRQGPLTRLINRVTFLYGLVAGALPDFWIGLMFVFFLYFVFRIVPAPVGQVDITLQAPHRITGMYVVDSLLTGNWTAFRSAVTHLILPALTLAFVYGGPVIKMVRSSVGQVKGADFVNYADACGLPQGMLTRYTLRNALPPVITLTAVMYAYLLAGAVLVETIFSWGGMGQYAVQSIANSDYLAIQAVVLVAGIFSLVIYLVIDLVHLAIDPRVSY
jgi:ABC-type dipeptide/oligopeptide/nickel transport system permease component